MKQMSFLALLFAALFMFLSTGTGLAGEYGETSESYMPKGEEGMIAPDPASSWQFEGAVETGTLPRGEDLSEAKSGVTDEIPSHESGGLLFREGFDTGP
jgi:hypothetical protein